jgi:hypothetical protein
LARFIPQHLFDGLVIKHLMCEIADTPDEFDKLISAYQSKYPDEKFETLQADIVAAGKEGYYVIKVLMDAPGSPYRAPMDALKAVMDAYALSLSLEKPLWRRMVENYFTNVQPAPIPDRVEKAKDHLVRAERLLMQRLAPVE